MDLTHARLPRWPRQTAREFFKTCAAIVFAPAVQAAILQASDELLRIMMNIVECVFGWNPGLEQWLLREPSGTVGTA